MNQVGLEQVWLRFLKLYVSPLQEKVFIGYYHSVSKLLNSKIRETNLSKF